jgi:cell wall-associated NlpC family hydrolase
MSALPAVVYRDLIGLPFERGGRGPRVFDCWGTLQEVSRRMGRNPTDFPTDPALLATALADEWEEIKRAHILPGDGILLRSSDSAYQWHIGVVIDQWKMLHAREGVGVCVEMFDSPVYKRRVVGFYRFRGV